MITTRRSKSAHGTPASRAARSDAAARSAFLRRRGDGHQVDRDGRTAGFTDARRLRIEAHLAIDARQHSSRRARIDMACSGCGDIRDRNKPKADLRRHRCEIAVVDRAAAQVSDHDDLRAEGGCRSSQRVASASASATIGRVNVADVKGALQRRWQSRTDRPNRA
jgi:hypothetical protein